MNRLYSLAVFGSYMMGLGVCLASAPNLVMCVLGLPETHEPWPRVLGALVAVFGAYYVIAYRSGLVVFARATVAGRLVFLGFCAALVLSGQMRWTFLLALSLDAAGAVWTALELRAARAARSPS